MIGIARLKKRTRLVNPQPRARRRNATTTGKARSRTRKTNPIGELITLGIVNPQRGNMRKQTRKTNPAKKAARRRRNPVVVYKASGVRKRRNGARRRNPSFIGSTKQMVTSGAYALAGLVAARQLPQLILKAKNTGVIGYAANIAAALAASIAAGKLAGPEAGSNALVGGGLYVVNRIITEQFTPAGKLLSLSGVGDASASATLGRTVPGAYPLPMRYDNNGAPMIAPGFATAISKAMPAQPAKPVVNSISGVARSMRPAI